MTPDEDGYVELVSVLPGVTADLMNNAATWTGRALGGGQRNWRSIRSSRAQSVDSGIVRRPKGVDAIRYEFELPGLFVSATGRVNDAALVALSVNDSPAPGFVPPDDNDGAHRTRVTGSRAVGDFTVAVDDRGALVVSHPAHLGPVVADPHPVAGASAAGPRRPLSRPVLSTSLSTAGASTTATWSASWSSPVRGTGDSDESGRERGGELPPPGVARRAPHSPARRHGGALRPRCARAVARRIAWTSRRPLTRRAPGRPMALRSSGATDFRGSPLRRRVFGDEGYGSREGTWSAFRARERRGTTWR